MLKERGAVFLLQRLCETSLLLTVDSFNGSMVLHY